MKAALWPTRSALDPGGSGLSWGRETCRLDFAMDAWRFCSLKRCSYRVPALYSVAGEGRRHHGSTTLISV